MNYYFISLNFIHLFFQNRENLIWNFIDCYSQEFILTFNHVLFQNNCYAKNLGFVSFVIHFIILKKLY